MVTATVIAWLDPAAPVVTGLGAAGPGGPATVVVAGRGGRARTARRGRRAAGRVADRDTLGEGLVAEQAEGGGNGGRGGGQEDGEALHGGAFPVCCVW